MAYLEESLTKYVTIKRLRELIEEIPEDWVILPNRVGNLNIYPPDFEENPSWGFIDLGGEELELFPGGESPEEEALEKWKAENWGRGEGSAVTATGSLTIKKIPAGEE